MTGEEIEEDVLRSIFEAVRWASSIYNNQLCRSVYETRGWENWEGFVELLNDFNRKWARNASALVGICSKKPFDFNGEPSRTHFFDTGAA